MTYPLANQAYSVATGASKIGAPLFYPRDPTQYDVSYPIQQYWVNTQTQGIWILETLVASNGTVTAQWRSIAPVVLKTTAPTSSDYLYPLGQIWGNTSTSIFYILVAVSGTTATWDVIGGPTAGDISTLTGNTGGAVTGDASGNVNILGAAGQIAVTGSPGTNTLTISLTGAGTAIDSFQPDSGTNPVVPDGTGLVRMAGNGSITTVGGTNTLTTELTGLTNHAVLVGAGTTTITKLGVGATGTLLVGASAADPAFATSAEGDFAFTQSNAASATNRKLAVTNADTTSSASNSQIITSVGGTSSGDPYLLTAIGAGRSYALGPDVSASNTFKLTTIASSSASPRTGTLLSSMTTTGIQTLPLQPALKAYLATSLTNQTGGSSGTFVSILFDTILASFTQGSISYNAATGEFTIPSNGGGIYSLTCFVGCNNIGTTVADCGFGISVNGSLAYASAVAVNPASVRTNRNTLRLLLYDSLKLAAGDVVIFQINLQDSGGGMPNTVGFDGSNDAGGTLVTGATLVKIA